MFSVSKRFGSLAAVAVMLLSGLGASASAQATQEPGPGWEQTRLQFAHRPFDNATGLPDKFIDDRGLYVNPFDAATVGFDKNGFPPVANASLRLYGEPGRIAPRLYQGAGMAFDPTVIPKDSVTFNPALILSTDDDFTPPLNGVSGKFDWIRYCGQDAAEKKYLRAWYEPGHDYHGPRVDAQLYTPATRGDVIQVESTYTLLDLSSLRPVVGCAEHTELAFPTQGVHVDPADGHQQPGLDTLTRTRIGAISPGTSTNGTIEVEQEVVVSMYKMWQFLDHGITFKGIVTDLSGAKRAQFDIVYLGNTFPDARRQVDLRERYYFTRFNSFDPMPVHGDPSNTRTWYAELISYNEKKETATLLLGKELRQGDIFYVDGVRYEIPAIATIDGQFSYITLRTPLPKSDPRGSWTSVTDPTRENRVDGQWQVQDFSVVTSQWLVEVDYADPIPVDPPYNRDTYRMVDDTDIQLWKAGCNETYFPFGAPANPLTVQPKGTGMPPYPEGERHLTQMSPPQKWKDHFCVEPTGFLDEGGSYALSMLQRFASNQDGLNHGAWQPGLSGPQTFNNESITFYWIKEWFEGRYSTNLLEILKENDVETFTKYEINSLPDQYTTFVLPDRQNPASELFANLSVAYPCTRMDIVPGGSDQANCTKRVKLLGGDYLVVTSFRLQDQRTRFAFAHDPWMEDNVLHRFDLYFNGINITELFQGARPEVANTTVRLYGEHGLPNHAPLVFSNYWDSFDPYVIPKDSATFNPALILSTDRDFTFQCKLMVMEYPWPPPVPRCPIDDPPSFDWIRACGHDAHLKKHLRLWYEPAHNYSGPRVPAIPYAATQADVVQVESTYLLIDTSTYLPVHGCPHLTELPFPTAGVHLDLLDGHEQPGLDTMTRTRVGNVSAGTGVNGTVELEQDVNFWYNGQRHQFLDHMLEFKGLVTDLNGDVRAQFDLYYIGNTYRDAQKQIEVRNKTYYTRFNAPFATPDHDDPWDARTWYVKMASFNAYAESVTVTVGKELRAGDVFYADGVRYEVPAVHTVDGDFKYITLRTPLPKSDPEGSWTTVSNPTRDELIDGQFQVQDFSVVSSQWLVQVDNKDPIPVDPPFNRDTYRMVDDTDVRLWEPKCDIAFFPYGAPAKPLTSVPPGTGLPPFPEGERYVTQMSPPQEWKDHFCVEPTGFQDEGDSYAMSMPQRFSPHEPGLNAGAWDPMTLTGPQFFFEDRITFYWVKEWFEGRYSTNLLEILAYPDFVKHEVNSLPDQFTEFVLPDRQNPASHWMDLLGLAGPPCTRKDLVNIYGNCTRAYPILGGDYLITTSLVLEDDLVSGGGGSGGTGGSGGSSGGSGGSGGSAPPATHAFDANRDCVLNDDEVLALVAEWGAGRASDDTLLSGVAAWGRAPARYC